MLHDVGSTIGVVKFMESATNWEVDPEIEPLWAYVYYEHLEVTSDSHSLHMASCMLFGIIHHPWYTLHPVIDRWRILGD